MTKLTRRTVMASLAALPLLTQPALALTTAQATDLVERMTADILKTINSGRSDSAMFKEFEKLLNKYADMPTIARFSLGPTARTASAGELRAYTNAFRPYLAKKYGQRFREFIGGDVEITRSQTTKRGVVVHARAKVRGQSPAPVEFHVSDRSGKVKVFNVVVEGINLLSTERTEITALLDQQGGSMSKLTAELKRRS